MATDHNFRIKNGLEVGGELIVDSSGHLVVADITSNQKFHDDVRLRFGNSSDLQIYHSGNNSFISHSNTSGYLRIGAGTKELFLHGDRVDLRSDTGNESMIRAFHNGAVELYHDNVKRIETISGGAQVTGSLTVTGDINLYGDINTQNVTNLDVQDKVITVGKGQSASNSTGSGLVVSGSNANMLWDNSDDRWEFNKDVYTDGAFEVGNIRIYKSGDSNHLHINAPTAIIGPSTTTSSNPSLGTSAYRFDGVWSSTGNFAGNVVVTGEISNVTAIRHANSNAQVIDNDNDTYFILNDPEGINRILIGDSGDRTTTFRNNTFLFQLADGTEKVRIDTSGRVGIKNSSPSSQYFNTLVVGDTSGEHGITIQSSATSRGVLAFSDTNSATAGRYDGYIAYNHNSTYMSFHTNTGNEHMRIDSSGKVGIGTTSASKKFEVHDNGRTFRVGEKSGYSVGYGPIIETNSDAIVMPTTVWINNSNVRLYKESTSARLHGDGGIRFGYWNGSASVEGMRMTNDGRLGIGTTSPAFQLSVDSGTTDWPAHFKSTDNKAGIIIADDDTTAYFGAESSRAFMGIQAGIHANNLNIDSDGDVGINTTSPGYRLDIGGSTGSTANTLRLHQNNGGTAIRIGAGSGSSDVVLFRIDGDSTNSNHGGTTDLGGYGYSLKYFGSGSGQENRLKLLSDNLAASSQNVVFDVGQNGYINFEQRVGIGTDSAQDRLNIHDSASDANLGIKITRGSQTHGLRLGVNDSHAFLWTSEAQNLAFATSGTQRMAVLSGGQVAINANSARTVGGTARFTIADSTVMMNMGPSNSDNMYIRRMGGGLFQFQTYNSGNSGHIELEPYGGKVGIGTQNGTVSATLHVQNTSTNAEVMRLTTTGDDPDRHMYFQSDHIYSNGNFYLGDGGQRNLYRGSYHTFHYGSGNTEIMRLINGRVGIGTNSPSTTLHIHGAAGNPAKLAISEGGAESRIYTTRNSDDNSDLRFQTEIGGTIADRLKIDYSGNTVVTGNLIVQGTTTTLNTATLDVEDKNITLNYGSGDTSGTADGAGITVQDAVNSSTDAYFKWFQSGNKWLSSNPIRAFGGFELPDNNKLVAGDSNDLEIFHNGTDSIINEKGTGTLRIQTNGSNQWEFNGTIFKGNDGREIVLGDSSDLKIFHDGSHSEIREQGTGDLRIRGDSVWVLASSGQNQISAAGGVAKLYNSGSEKLATESTGVNVTGRLKAADVTVYEGTSLAGGMFKEKQVTGSGSSNDLTFFAEGISNGGDIHFMTGGSATVRATISSTGLNVPGRIDLSNSGYISFYGNGSEDHSIGGYLDDDIRINSYGGVFISLDSNGNNDSAADFLIGKHAGASTAFGTNDQLFKIRGDGRAGDVITVGNIGLGATLSYPKVAYPGSEAQWSASGTSTGQVIIDLPGTLNNYDMMYMEIDIYEYGGEAASKIIFGGHNWNSGGDSGTSNTMWHNTDVKIVGEFSKSIYVGWRNNGSVNKRVIVLGEPSSTWSYGSVHVSKVHGANLFYTTGIDWTGDWNVTQSTSSSAYNKSPSTNFNDSDRRVLRVHRAIQGQRVYGDTDIRSPVYYDLNDTTYRADPASTSKLKNLDIGNTDSTAGIFKVYDTGNNALELKSTGSNAFRYDMIGTSATGSILYQDFEHTFTNSLGGITVGKAVNHTDTTNARITSSSGTLYLDSAINKNLYLGWYSSSSYDVISEMSARFPRYRDRNDTQYLLDPANTGTSLNIAGGISTGSDGTSANWKQAYDNYITGVSVSGSSTKTITLTQRDGGTISANWSDLTSDTNNYVENISFSAGTVRGGTSGTGVLTLGRSGSLGDLTVDLDGRYLQRQYMNNWTRVGYGNSGSTVWHKLCTITITGAYQDYNVGFFWTDRYDRGEASIHVHSDNDTTADVWAARFVGTADSNRKSASDLMYTKSGSTVEIFVKTPGWREFDYIRNDAVTEGTPSITWYDESTTTEYSSQPSNTTAFSDQTPISQNGYNRSFNGDLQDRDNTQFYLDPNSTSVLSQLDVATNIRHMGDSDTYIQFTDGEIDLFANGQNTFLTSSGGVVINPNSVSTCDFIARGDNDSALLYVDSSADNVGIGTSAPSQKLHVNGTIRAGIAGNSSANLPALKVYASGASNSAKAAIAIQQGTSEGDTIIFADYEPHVEYGISAQNSTDQIHFTAGTSTNNLGSKTVYNNAGSARTAYIKFSHDLTDGKTLIGGNTGIGTNNPTEKLEVNGNIKNSGNMRINAGTSDYTGQTNVDETILRMQTDYDGAGSQNLQFVNHNGNWTDGTSGVDSAYGWMWGYQNNIRAGIHYDHRGSEKFDFYSSYGEIRFRTPGGVNGNISPIGSESTMPVRLTIGVGGAVTAHSNMRSPVFYDSANTSYFLDAANTGQSMTVAGSVTVAANTTSNEFYANNWFRNNNSGEGLYNQATGQHFYSDDDDYWNVAGGTAANGIRFRDDHAGTIRGYVYANNSNEVGLLDASAHWAVRHKNDSFTEFRVNNVAKATIDNDGIKLEGDLGNGHQRALRNSANLAGANLVTAASDIARRYGNGSQREFRTFVDGNKVACHYSQGVNNSGSCYQWISTEWIDVDPEKDYEYSIWVQAEGDHNIYMGWHEKNASGTTISSNPYMHTSTCDTNGGWVKLTARLKGHRTPSGQSDSEGTDRYASNNSWIDEASGVSSTDGVMHSTTRRILMRFGTCYGTANTAKTYFYLPSIREISYEYAQQAFIIPNIQNNIVQAGSLHIGRTDWSGYSGLEARDCSGSQEFRMSSTSGDLNLRVDGWGLFHGAEGVQADQFKDINNAAYYLRPADTSNLHHVDFNGMTRVITGSIAENTSTTTKGFMFDGNYTNGQYRHRFRKQDKGGGVPLYLDYAAGTANSYTPIARFGPWSNNTQNFEVFGGSRFAGAIEVAGGLTHLRGGHSSSHNEQVRIGRSDDVYRYHSIFATNNSTASILEFKLHDGGNSTSQTGLLSLRQNLSSTGDMGTLIHTGTRLGFDESGTRSWTIKAASGGLNLYSGDGAGHFQTHVSGGSRAPIFYDSDDTARYLNLNGTNTSELGRIRTNASASLTAPRWDTSFYVAQSQHYYGHSSSQTMYLGEANHIHIRNIADIAGSARAPIYYDKDNTSYYLDAANSTTAAFVNGTIKINSNHNHGNFVMHYNHGNDTDSGQLCSWISEPGISYNNGGIGANIHEQGPYYGRFINSGYGVYARFKKSDGLFEIYTTTATRGNTGGQGTRRFYVDASGHSHSIVSSRAPIFYDSNSTSYYTDPASTSNINGLQMAGSLLLTAEGATNIKTRFIMGKASGNTNNGELYINYGQSSDVHIGAGGGASSLHVSASVRAPIFYDSANTSYYVDPYDRSFYRLGNPSTASGSAFDGDAAGRRGLSWYHSMGPDMTLWGYGSGSGVNAIRIWAAAGANSTVAGDKFEFKHDGSLHADGDITAFSTTTTSDIRLKENVRDLEGSLDKTLQLRGVKFDWKEEGKGNDQLGFIAQEIEEVLPEVVNEVDSLNATDEKYKVVNYQAVVPVLVEAIKELKAEIDELKEQLKKK